jgi:hypothetical protein
MKRGRARRESPGRSLEEKEGMLHLEDNGVERNPELR